MNGKVVLVVIHRKVAALALALVMSVGLLSIASPAAYADGTPTSQLTVHNYFFNNEVFYISGCAVWRTSNTSNNMGGCVLSGNGYGIQVGMNYDGRLEVFAVGTDHAIWHNWQTDFNSYGDGNWSGWYSLGGYVTAGPIVSSYLSNSKVISVGARGLNGDFWQINQTQSNCCWSAWTDLGVPY